MANYVNNKDFYDRLKKYRKTGDKKIYEELGKDFMLIATNFALRSSFINYTPDRKQEMISSAVFYMVKYISKFDLTRFNAFAYFSTIARNAFLQELNEFSRRDEFFTNIEYIDQCDTNENLL